MPGSTGDLAVTARHTAHTMTSTLFAQAPAEPPAQGPQGGPNSPMFMFFVIGLMLLFWVVVILPMSRRQKKEQEQLIATLKRGAKVLTNAGIIGTIVSAKDGEDEVVIKSEDSRLRIKRNVIVQVIGTDEAEATAK
ncbi:MAG: preprotein translocase subunit YajC [Planctomycetes bacterium]|nr:preprotein translocase subunit YajC [Planctomycetota bacterium]